MKRISFLPIVALILAFLMTTCGAAPDVNFDTSFLGGGGGGGVRPHSSFPSSLTNMNGTLYFTATHGTSSLGLWKSDGTEAGTVLVKDIMPGSSLASADLTNMNGVLYFTAYDGTNGTELWKSDGTEAGTVLVKDIYPGSAPSFPSNLTNVNGVLYFTAYRGTNGPMLADNELWKSDGTTEGTVLVKDIYPGTVSSSPTNLINVNGILFFTADDGTHGIELWKSDGTEGGTVLVKDINSGTFTDYSGPHPSNSFTSTLTNVNGVLYFTADDGTHGIELWKSDGTEAGTVLVKDIMPAGSSIPAALTNVNGVLYFTAADETHGIELWKSNGTDGGTVLVKDIYPRGTDGAYPANQKLTNVNGLLYFSASNGTNGYELWRSDGTEAGTVMVKDINSGTAGSWPANFTNVNGVLYFAATDGTNGYVLWKSDGTEAGTVLVKDFYPGTGDSSPTNLTNVNGVLYFTAYDATNGNELWKSDGTEAGTVLVKDIYPGSGYEP